MIAMVTRLPRLTPGPVLIAFVLMAAVSLLRPAHAETEWDPGDFIRDLSDRAIVKLTDQNAGEKEKEQDFRVLMNEGFDIRAIGQFVLGRYWRRANEMQRRDFMAAFEDMIVYRFLPLFSEYSGETLEIGLIRPFSENPNFFNVTTRLELRGSEAINVDFRVRRAETAYKIVDVVAEGVSYAVTLRSEYASVLKQNGGDVNALIRIMREAKASL